MPTPQGLSVCTVGMVDIQCSAGNRICDASALEGSEPLTLTVLVPFCLHTQDVMQTYRPTLTWNITKRFKAIITPTKHPKALIDGWRLSPLICFTTAANDMVRVNDATRPPSFRYQLSMRTHRRPSAELTVSVIWCCKASSTLRFPTFILCLYWGLNLKLIMILF